MSVNEMGEKFALILIGWMLGLFSPLILDHMRQQRDNERGRKAILSELQEVGRILAVAVFSVKSKQGTIDRAHLEWLKAFMEACDPTSSTLNWIKELEQQLEWTDDEIAQRFLYAVTAEGKGILLQKYPVPLLDSRVSALWSFETSFQRSLLDIRQRLGRLDDLVDRQRKLHDMTFTKLEAGNREAVDDNMRETCSFYAESAKIVVDLISKLSEK
jgi:hypothetical protein